ncbi:hypothetical protein [Microbacterium sp. GXS0129]|uniref:hypothetical protein n=1 Tax=Microbacterium sp. GXS0129 TaxID=3377836 RepID=UPI00383A6428
MYAINNVPLQNATFGWIERAPTEPLSALVRRRRTMQVSGVDGVVPGLGSTMEAVVLRFVVQTPRENLETLNALFGDAGTLTQVGLANRSVAYETLSSTPLPLNVDGDEIVDMQYMIQLPRAFWRATGTVTSPATPLDASVTVTGLFPGLSAPVTDAIVRVKGESSGVRIVDSGGSWVSMPALTASQYGRFHLDTGECFITTSNTWTGGTDASGLVDFGGIRGGFEFTPRLASGDPSDREARITVTAVTWPGATIEVRGRSAHQL